MEAQLGMARENDCSSGTRCQPPLVHGVKYSRKRTRVFVYFYCDRYDLQSQAYWSFISIFIVIDMTSTAYHRYVLRQHLIRPALVLNATSLYFKRQYTVFALINCMCARRYISFIHRVNGLERRFAHKSNTGAARMPCKFKRCRRGWQLR